MPSLSPNQLNSASNVDDQQNEILSEKQSLTHLQNEIGSKVLSLVNFESKHKDIVESSFNKARQNKEKLPGKNNERRNFAYLSRLDRMIEKHGDKVEQKLWEASAENLVMDYEDIPESHWKQQERILRDNGQGRELSRYEKEYLAEDIVSKQRESINTWSNYLGDKDCPYPTWFKVYAFDGVSKMGLINKETKEFEKRDKTTVASFPTLNPEVLAKVYRNINEFYAVNKEDWLAQHPDDEKLVSLIKSGNFPKLYAKELFDTKTIIKTPENPEDVEGDWFTYQLGDEDELAKTAEGTGWCIADPNVAHNYLSYGNYAGNENDWEDDEDWEDDDEDDDEDWEDEEEDWKEEEDNNNWGEDENNPEEDNESNPKAKFIVFKLKAPNSPDGYSTNGVASIRLDPDGKVTEVSGLNEGQAIEDSLIPTVKEKVLSLPGGKEFLQKFEDKQTLIKLDHKMQNGEDLTKEELSFLYELDRPIATLDTYNSRDPRITELKEKYGIEYTLEKGVDANKLASSLEPEDIAKNLDPLIRHGVDIDINELVSDLDSVQIAKNLDKLIEHGADIDVNELVSSLYPDDIAYNLEYLLEHGASVNNLVNNMMSYDIIANLDYLLEHGADINNIENNIDSDDTSDNLDYLLEHGADINNILDNMDSDDISYNLDSLLKNGVDINNIVNHMDSDDIKKRLDYFLEHGADINNIVNHMGSDDIAYDPDYLLKHGADINNIVNHMYPEDIEKRLDYLLEHGTDINNIVNHMYPEDIEKRLDYLLEHGAEIDVNKLVSDLDFLRIADNLDILLRNGADVDNVIKRLDKKGIKDNIDLLRKYGANLDDY